MRPSLTHFIETLSTHTTEEQMEDDRGTPVVTLLTRLTKQIINEVLL